MIILISLLLIINYNFLISIFSKGHLTLCSNFYVTFPSQNLNVDDDDGDYDYEEAIEESWMRTLI